MSEKILAVRSGAPPVRGKGDYFHPARLSPGLSQPSFSLYAADFRQRNGRKVFMGRRLTSKSNLDTLKKEAKRWLKAICANDLDARTRLRRAYPKAPAEPGLRDIQHALAQEHGLANWVELKDKLSEYALA